MAKGTRRLVKIIGLGLVVAAVATELNKPPAEREWHGRVGGIVPYDFRMPTWDRLRNAYWNPADDRVFTERVLGVGWAVNLYRVKILLTDFLKLLSGGVYESESDVIYQSVSGKE